MNGQRVQQAEIRAVVDVGDDGEQREAALTSAALFNRGPLGKYGAGPLVSIGLEKNSLRNHESHTASHYVLDIS
jgi:hypothetical protein